MEEVFLSEDLSSGCSGDGDDGNDADADGSGDASSFTNDENEGSTSLGPQPENMSAPGRPFGNFVLPPYWNAIPVGDLRYAIASCASNIAVHHEINLLPNSSRPSRNQVEMPSISTRMSLRELREREGIPDVEGESDDPRESDGDTNGYLSHAAGVNDVYCNHKQENVSQYSVTSDGQENYMQKETKYTCETQPSSAQTGETAEFTPNMSVHSSRDLHEALRDIKETIDNIIMHGKDVMQLLGPYQQGTPSNNGVHFLD